MTFLLPDLVGDVNKSSSRNKIILVSTVCSDHVTYTFQSESTLYICLNGKELLAQNRCYIWSLSDCKGTRTHNNLVHKWTLKRLAKLTKWLSWIVRTYLFDAFDYKFFLCHRRISAWTRNLYLPECQGIRCSKQARYLKFKWLQRDSNPQPISS